MTILKTKTKYDQLSGLSDTQFKRLTGVQRTTFTAMVEILTVADASRKARGGRASKLCVEDRLLMTLGGGHSHQRQTLCSAGTQSTSQKRYAIRGYSG